MLPIGGVILTNGNPVINKKGLICRGYVYKFAPLIG